MTVTCSMPVTPQGLPTSSMQWGAWAGAGMVGQAPALASHLAHLGMGLLLPQEGLSALRKVLQDQCAHPGALPPVNAATRVLTMPFQLHMNEVGTCRAHQGSDPCGPADMGQAAGGWARTLTLL